MEICEQGDQASKPKGTKRARGSEDKPKHPKKVKQATNKNKNKDFKTESQRQERSTSSSESDEEEPKFPKSTVKEDDEEYNLSDSSLQKEGEFEREEEGKIPELPLGGDDGDHNSYDPPTPTYKGEEGRNYGDTINPLSLPATGKVHVISTHKTPILDKVDVIKIKNLRDDILAQSQYTPKR